MHMSDCASSLNSDQVYCVRGFNQRAHRFSLARGVVTKNMILSPFSNLTDFTIHIDAINMDLSILYFQGSQVKLFF